MIVVCPQCGKRYRLDDQKVPAESVKMRCSGCDAVFGARESLEEGSSPPPPGTQAPVSGKRVLVCDDAPFFRTMLNDILTEGGFSVETASNGAEAVSRIGESKPDLIVLDLQMPEMDGFEVIRTVRRDEKVRDLPILAMSAVFTDSSDMIELQDAGADDYIGKKFSPGHLIKRVRKLLGMPPAGE